MEACPNRFSEELGTQVYAVPVRELSWGEEYAKIEEQVLRHEREGQKSKGGKKKKDNVANAEASSDGELDLPAAEGSVSDKKGKPEVDRKKLLAKNVALADKAAKALGPLQGTATGVSKLLEKWRKVAWASSRPGRRRLVSASTCMSRPASCGRTLVAICCL